MSRCEEIKSRLVSVTVSYKRDEKSPDWIIMKGSKVQGLMSESVAFGQEFKGECGC